MINRFQKAAFIGVFALLGATTSASASCEMACLEGLVTRCADSNSSVGNWWEFGNGFQTCVAANAPGECNAMFREVQSPGFSLLVMFRSTTSEVTCGIPTGLRE